MGSLCWHCCLPFDPESAIPLPIEYDSKKDVFKVMGTFCSFSCSKAYAKETMASHTASLIFMLITVFYKRCTGHKATHIQCAPPRCLLKAFGGPLSEAEFCHHRGRTEYSVLPKNMVVYHHSIEQNAYQNTPLRGAHGGGTQHGVLTAKEKAARKVIGDSHVEFKPTLAANETLRLRRPKPPKHDKDLLARTMGLTSTITSTKSTV
jgi:hypothetical protein